MTVIAALHLPAHGCVMAADGRITADNNTICVDDDVKLFRRGALLIGTAGSAAAIMGCQARSLMDLHEHDFGDLDIEWLVYDRDLDQLWNWTSEGPSFRGGALAAGSGADFATASLDSVRVKTLADARRAVVRAAALACKYQSQCGGKIRTKMLRSATPDR